MEPEGWPLTCSTVRSAPISCPHFNVSIGQVDEHAGKNSIFLPDELLNHLGDGWVSEKNPYPFYLLSFIGRCSSGHQKPAEEGAVAVDEDVKPGELAVDHNLARPVVCCYRCKTSLALCVCDL